MADSLVHEVGPVHGFDAGLGSLRGAVVDDREILTLGGADLVPHHHLMQ